MPLGRYFYFADKKRKENEKLKHTSLLTMLIFVSLIAVIPLVPLSYAQNGPILDIIRHKVVQSPDQSLLQMRTNLVDMSEGLIRVSDVETLASDGNLITQDLGFHMGFIGYNIRDLASTDRVSGGVGWKDTDVYSYRTDLIGHYWPLAHVEFRHALVLCYDQLGIIPPIYGYTVTPVRSLVPPAESKYYNPNAQAYPYNPGDPFTHAAGTSCGVLYAAGYRFVDADSSGTVTDADYWKCPNNEPMPHMLLYTPLIDIAPTSFQHGLEFVNDLTAIGLGATTANGNKGFTHQGFDFQGYLNLVYGTTSASGGQFDAFMVFYSLGRIPDQLYTMLHSSQDSAVAWQMSNSAGVNDAGIDALCDQVKYSLDANAIETAAKEIQLRMYDTSYSYALSYMVLYSRSYFDCWDKNLQGIVKSPGYGADNSWTWLAMNWKTAPRMEGTKTVGIYVNGDVPGNFNQLYATTVYSWNIIGQVLDGLTNVNPYNHQDIPWIASSWSIVPTSGGMTIHFTLRNDVQWQDGKPFTADDAAWCLNFMYTRQVPRYWNTIQTLVSATAIDATHLDVIANKAGLSLFYDYSGLAAYLPKHIWDRPWASNQAVLDYDPTVAYNVAPGYTAGPHPTPTNLFGTGPYIFQFYNPTGGYDDMWRNPNYFMSQAAVATLMTNMFWEVGDQSKNGVVDVTDYTAVSLKFGLLKTDPGYDPNCNFNNDDIIDMVDFSNCAYHLDWAKTYSA
jgi:ABC-type transport system substrate-binding protein